MNSYKFVLINKEGEKCYQIPKAVIEREYGLLEEENYIFFTAEKNNSQVIYLKEHPIFKKRLDNRLAI